MRMWLVMVGLLGLVAACAEKQRVVRPRANPKGQGIAVEVVEPTITTGTSCPEGITAGVAARAKGAAESALTAAGFRISSEEKTTFGAMVHIEISYCSEAGIVNGSTKLDLDYAPADESVILWGDSANGDMAKPETMQSTLNELVERMTFDPGVIAAVDEAVKK
jgi:hypothetical protein